MISEMTCRMMAESDIDLVVPFYIEHYNTYENGAWTQETTYKRIRQVWSQEAHEHQGKGIGMQFMGLIEAKVKELGGAMIQLEAVNDC